MGIESNTIEKRRLDAELASAREEYVEARRKAAPWNAADRLINIAGVVTAGMLFDSGRLRYGEFDEEKYCKEHPGSRFAVAREKYERAREKYSTFIIRTRKNKKNGAEAADEWELKEITRSSVSAREGWVRHKIGRGAKKLWEWINKNLKNRIIAGTAITGIGYVLSHVVKTARMAVIPIAVALRVAVGYVDRKVSEGTSQRWKKVNAELKALHGKPDTPENRAQRRELITKKAELKAEFTISARLTGWLAALAGGAATWAGFSDDIADTMDISDSNQRLAETLRPGLIHAKDGALAVVQELNPFSTSAAHAAEPPAPQGGAAQESQFAIDSIFESENLLADFITRDMTSLHGDVNDYAAKLSEIPPDIARRDGLSVESLNEAWTKVRAAGDKVIDMLLKKPMDVEAPDHLVTPLGDYTNAVQELQKIFDSIDRVRNESKEHLIPPLEIPPDGDPGRGFAGSDGSAHATLASDMRGDTDSAVASAIKKLGVAEHFPPESEVSGVSGFTVVLPEHGEVYFDASADVPFYTFVAQIDDHTVFLRFRSDGSQAALYASTGSSEEVRTLGILDLTGDPSTIKMELDRLLDQMDSPIPRRVDDIQILKEPETAPLEDKNSLGSKPLYELVPPPPDKSTAIVVVGGLHRFVTILIDNMEAVQNVLGDDAPEVQTFNNVLAIYQERQDEYLRSFDGGDAPDVIERKWKNFIIALEVLKHAYTRAATRAASYPFVRA